MCSYNKLYYQKRNQYLRISGSRVLGRLMSLNCGARKKSPSNLHRAKLANSREMKKRTPPQEKEKKITRRRAEFYVLTFLNFV